MSVSCPQRNFIALFVEYNSDEPRPRIHVKKLKSQLKFYFTDSTTKLHERDNNLKSQVE
jgi:hypothetical protein